MPIGSRRFILILGLLACSGSLASGAEPNLRPPQNLSAWFSGSYVQLVWDRDLAQDLAGYAVYRSLSPVGRWRKLTDAPFPSVTFVDVRPPQGTVRYWVKSVGPDGRESAEGYVIEVTVTPSPERLPRPAETFNKNNIITDPQLLNLSTLPSVETIQDFLDAHGSALATHETVDRYDRNVVKSAARMIFDACHTWGINPQVVLTTLQKEKGLIKSNIANPENFAMGWNETADSTKDFAAQVYKGTRQFRYYFDRIPDERYRDTTGLTWNVGQTQTVYDGTVTPANKATAGLYIYTPWIGEFGGGRPGIGGNSLFWRLWNETFHFGPAVVIPARPKTFSPGSLDEAEIKVIATTTPTLTWEAVEGTDFYEVYVSRHPYGDSNLVYQNVWIPGPSSSHAVPEGKLASGVDYRWNMVATNAAGRGEFSDRRYFRIEAPTEGYVLEQNFPNPFNSVTNIRFTLPAPQDVKITVYNASGQRVTTLVSGHFVAGTHQVSWRPDSAASGIYFYRLEAGPFVRTKRLVLMR